VDAYNGGELCVKAGLKDDNVLVLSHGALTHDERCFAQLMGYERQTMIAMGSNYIAAMLPQYPHLLPRTYLVLTGTVRFTDYLSARCIVLICVRYSVLTGVRCSVRRSEYVTCIVGLTNAL